MAADMVVADGTADEDGNNASHGIYEERKDDASRANVEEMSLRC